MPTPLNDKLQHTISQYTSSIVERLFHHDFNTSIHFEPPEDLSGLTWYPKPHWTIWDYFSVLVVGITFFFVMVSMGKHAEFEADKDMLHWIPIEAIASLQTKLLAMEKSVSAKSEARLEEEIQKLKQLQKELDQTIKLNRFRARTEMVKMWAQLNGTDLATAHRHLTRHDGAAEFEDAVEGVMATLLERIQKDGVRINQLSEALETLTGEDMDLTSDGVQSDRAANGNGHGYHEQDGVKQDCFVQYRDQQNTGKKAGDPGYFYA
ncbi:hypothetical protein P153DRAFT_356975 [Dothidotthia symphoricarpi CBS 119687]|uniref:Uncharacterized protein n=1 Tax=Dothidotthia symphoricarpi CBS 119687 TaxID=1392245 RepID=A0A6A6AE66_9PLEO|nr:uncharacterized protein P153DRAFT_356975 [Dothidotthia symphoricarpi CBS 119687]KAF2129395.1 hypothetical protein P153DRAFT_356975 [Dothidotthia symphoricarpi CBS 119687]